MRLTIMTSNLKPNKIEQVYSADLAALLRETMIPLRISGYDWRAVSRRTGGRCYDGEDEKHGGL